MPRKSADNSMTLISLFIPEKALEIIDEMVRLGLTPSRSEFIRMAVMEALEKHYYARLVKELEKRLQLCYKEKEDLEFESRLLPGR